MSLLHKVVRIRSPLIVARRLFSSDPKVCVVGSGPAGFYVTQHLIKQGGANLTVDIFERLPVPFGLVRYGVAPDHPDVKNVDNTFTKIARHERVRFVGNVAVGTDVKVSELRQAYDVVVLAYGAAKDRMLEIPGETNLSNVVSARNFVGFYNGLPEASSLDIDLSLHDTAVVVGMGNVALDVARILLTPIDVLRKTDITDQALSHLARSRIKHVHIVGRRGPLQVAFTIKEFREMLHIPRCQPVFDPSHFVGIEDVLPKLGRPRKRLSELISKSALEPPTTKQIEARGNKIDKSWHLKLLRTPKEIFPDSTGKRVGAIALQINQLKGGRLTGEDQAVEGTDATETIECGLILRSIGYKSIPVEAGIPYDEKRGIIPNTLGRVEGEKGLYCAGWLATGPRGVIVDTMNEAYKVGQVIVDDWKSGKINSGESSFNKSGFTDVEKLFNERGIRPVSFENWEAIDRKEKEIGESSGKPREKFIDIKTMISVLIGTQS